jgi:protein SCO1/2
VDPSLAFRNQNGKDVVLGDLLSRGKPVILNFAYFHCPMLCGLVQDGLVKGLKELSWTPGGEYEVLTVGMDWREGPELAKPVRDRLTQALGKPGSEAGWHALTGEKNAVRALAASVGFKYNYLPAQNDFAHAAGLIFLGPGGKVARYLYGVEFSPRDLRLALLDASEGKALSLGDKIVMFCYRYDSQAGGYVLFARNFMKAGGVVVVALMLLLLVPLWRHESRKRLLAAGGDGAMRESPTPPPAG